MVAYLWLISFSSLFVVDSAVLLSIVLDRHWHWLVWIDSNSGRIGLSALLSIVVVALIRTVAISDRPAHLYAALILNFFTGLLLLLWGIFGYLERIAPYAMLATTQGKWIFTLGCTALCLPWLGGFSGQWRSAATALHMQVYREMHGRIYGFLYAWSGATYLLLKLYVLIASGLYLLWQMEWQAFLRGEGVLLPWVLRTLNL